MKRIKVSTPMLLAERKAVFSLASIFSLRMFGLFMLLPVLAVYAGELSGTTPVLMGLALGIYGLTQAIFQIPSGILSDRFGRKKIIALGLLIFALGSIIAALSDTIVWLIAGRAIQGAGAISAAVLALNADLTRSEQRTKAMAIIGISIGFTFLMSLVLAPVLQNIIGVDGLFWLIALLAGFAIIVLYKVVPEEPQNFSKSDNYPVLGQIVKVLKNNHLMQLNLGIMVIHLVLTSLFLVLPILIIANSGLSLSDHWKIYIPVLLISVLGMAPFVLAGSKPKMITISYRAAIGLMLISLGMIFSTYDYSLYWLLFPVTLFFTAFNALEALLPSLVSQIAPSTGKGAAIGVYNSFQFSGIFIGGLAGGWVYSIYGYTGVFGFCSIIVFALFAFSLFATPFKLSKTKVIDIGELDNSQKSKLVARIEQLEGIESVTTVCGETVAYLEVDEEVYDDADIEKLIRT